MIQAHDAQLILSCAHSDQFPDTHKPEIVMVGKSNVGKSSLINALTQRKRLAYVGQRPGKTRLILRHNKDLLLMFRKGMKCSHQEQRIGQLWMLFELRNPALMLIC